MSKQTPLDREIQTALQQLATENKDAHFDVARYIAAFRQSAIDKAHAVLGLLNQEDRFQGLCPAFLSIGGGDGTELIHLLRESDAGFGVLIEGSRPLAEIAREVARGLPSGKRLEVFDGDAVERLPEALKLVRREIAQGKADFVAVTCHAVIHELFDRRHTAFDPLGFFSSIFDDSETATWFTYREPGVPEKWPQDVLLEAACSPTSLLTLATEISRRHRSIRELVPAPQVTGRYLRLHATAAMELLAKLFYLHDLRHEIEERSTAVDHTEMMNYLTAATSAVGEIHPWRRVHSVSESTASFRRYWEEKCVHVIGLGQKGQQTDLGIPESQTRVIAWRLSTALHRKIAPELSMIPSPVSHSQSALALAQHAHSIRDGDLLNSLLVSSGRWWIESPEKASALELLNQVATGAPHGSLPHLWARYLLSINTSFSDPRNVPPATYTGETELAANALGLGPLFRAEQMELARKLGDREAAVNIANRLRVELSGSSPTRFTRFRRAVHNWWHSEELVDSQEGGNTLTKYARGTSMYLLANLLRSGGRYDLAVDWIARAEAILQSGIASHDAELAHCHYARHVCAAVMGRAEVAPARDDAERRTVRFAGALIILSSAHAAWFVDNVELARQHATRAAEQFRDIDADRYVKRAEVVEILLRVWQEGDPGRVAGFTKLTTELRAAMHFLSGRDTERSGFTRWFSSVRPSTAVGLLQFARRSQAVWATPLRLTLPPTIEASADGFWRWAPPRTVGSLAEADSTLRRLLTIPPDRRIPLITD